MTSSTAPWVGKDRPKSAKHLIAHSDFSKNSLRCTCGWETNEAVDPDDPTYSRTWSRHRSQTGETRR